MLDQIVTAILFVSKSTLATGIFYVSAAALVGLTIFIAIRFRFLGEKTNMLAKVKGEFSGKNIGWIIGGAFLMRVAAVIFTILMSGQQTLNDQNIQDSLQGTSLLSMFVLLCVIAPICEEVIFRGLFFNGVFRDKQGEQVSLKMDILGVVVTSALFSSVHLSNSLVSYLMYFSLGAILCMVYLLTKSLKCSIIVHFLNNFLPFLALAFLM